MNQRYEATLGLFPPSEPTHDPGGRVRIPAASWMARTAVFSDDMVFRYLLSVKWSDGPVGMFLMMNPSTADQHVNDPTVARTIEFGRSWGWGTLLVGNVFAYRATDQARLAAAADPIGPENDFRLDAMAREAITIVCAYGTPKVASLRSRGLAVARRLAALRAADGLPGLSVLRLSRVGIPCHPLYLPGALKPILWTPPTEHQ